MSNLYRRNGIWWARFKVVGVEYRFSLRTSAQGLAKKRLKVEYDRIVDKARFAIEGPVSWKAAVISWNEHVQLTLPISLKSLDRYKTSLIQLRRWLDDRHLHEINLPLLREMVRTRQREGVSNATIRRDLTAIGSVLNHAIDEGWLEENAAQAFNRRRVPERRDPIMLPTEQDIAFTIGPLQTRFGDMMLMALETGMREEEIAGLKHTAIDYEARVITFVGKRNKLRAIPLTAQAEAIIQRQPRAIKCPYVFWHAKKDRDGKVTTSRYQNVASNFADYTKRAATRAEKDGTPYRRFRFHDLRHLFAVKYLRSGKGGVYDLQRILGHTSIKTTEIYLAYLTPDEVRFAMAGSAQRATQTRETSETG